MNHLTRVIYQELCVIRISLYCLYATYYFWIRVNNSFVSWTSSSAILWNQHSGETRADCHCKVTWQLCSKTYTYYIGSYLFLTPQLCTWPFMIQWSQGGRSKGHLRYNEDEFLGVAYRDEVISWKSEQRMRWLLQMTLGFSVLVVEQDFL